MGLDPILGLFQSDPGVLAQTLDGLDLAAAAKRIDNVGRQRILGGSHRRFAFRGCCTMLAAANTKHIGTLAHGFATRKGIR